MSDEPTAHQNEQVRKLSDAERERFLISRTEAISEALRYMRDEDRKRTLTNVLPTLGSELTVSLPKRTNRPSRNASGQTAA